ncbi:hypothetical protein [Komagataeibacter saccharivorans]|uniref:hypothetical protein n=1 Tax=Komagataeibacter saccharivorans TaxID=265959 RepID=UPI0039EB34B4
MVICPRGSGLRARGHNVAFIKPFYAGECGILLPGTTWREIIRPLPRTLPMPGFRIARAAGRGWVFMK